MKEPIRVGSAQLRLAALGVMVTRGGGEGEERKARNYSFNGRGSRGSEAERSEDQETGWEWWQKGACWGL